MDMQYLFHPPGVALPLNMQYQLFSQGGRTAQRGAVLVSSTGGASSPQNEEGAVLGCVQLGRSTALGYAVPGVCTRGQHSLWGCSTGLCPKCRGTPNWVKVPVVATRVQQ